MLKIGVLNCFQIKNYGSVLQSYAMEKAIQNLGYNAVSIYYNKDRGLKQYMEYLPQLMIKEVVLMKYKGVHKKLYLKFKNKELNKLILQRNLKFDKFVQNNFNCSSHYIGIDNLKKYADDFSAFVLGSDQVWHPINLGSHYYTMEWIPHNKYKITYAASFGVSYIPKIQQKATCKYLSKINSISVRENSGALIVKQFTGKDVPVVLDPTLLLPKSHWDTIARQPNMLDEKYIFCYFLGNNKFHREFAEKLKRQTGFKIITLPYMDEIVEEDFDFGDYKLFDVGPSEFLGLIKNAEYICTDSFHGTIFSILYNKKFLTFSRHVNKSKGSTNSRIDTLLDSLCLTSRKMSDTEVKAEALSLISDDIDYNLVENKLKRLIEKSTSYLKAQLSNVEAENGS
ncbi:polysaccharide pyruvyl transferase family protein [Clostridium sp. HMP27]|uniref:polysaccharide pyruvyl transferase family protein n=1 Tax=Clostridium sp. HMP27 TaxID=1487921 RepID=UPI00052D9231|nr:polysaccharide pyruvyl transferase family protein [Clostridium sp. HMP27]KGK89556.1 hypothetical protein DP68_03615 [Clostridium sp. HMP27]